MRTEIDRVLGDGHTIHVLGGSAALSPNIDAALDAAGFDLERHAGADRFDTALLVAAELGSPGDVFLATGRNFPDALAAGAAASAHDGVVLLTDGTLVPSAVAAYLDNATTVVAVGGPAAQARPSAQGIIGADRYATAVLLAETFFDAFNVIGLATGQNFPDALSGGAHIAHFGGPLLLTPSNSLDPGVAGLLAEHRGAIVYLYGGVTALSSEVETLVRR